MKIKTLLSSPIHLDHHRSAVAPLSRRYCSAVAPLLLLCRSPVSPLSHRYRTAIVPLLLRRCRSVVALLSHRYRTGIDPLSHHWCRYCCCYTVAPLSHRYRATVAQLLSLLLLLRSRTAIAPLLLRSRAVVEPLSIRPREGINNSKFNCCCSNVAPLLLLLSIGRFTRLSPQEA